MSRVIGRMSLPGDGQPDAGIGRAALIIVVSILVSRILGFVRQVAINAEFGVGPEADAWFAAFRVPDTIFMMLAGGALLSAVIPVYAEVRSRGDKELLARFIGRVGGLVALASVVVAGAGAFLAEPLMRAIAPGFPDATLALATSASRWLMISPVVLAVSAVAKSALQAERSFTLPALSPIVYNVGIIVGAVGLARFFGLPGLVWGTLVGTGLHLLVQMPGFVVILGGRSNVVRLLRTQDWSLRPIVSDADLHKVFRLMVPRVLGVAVLQSSLIYVNILASLQGPSAVAALNNAFLLMLLPLGVFAMALGEASLPHLVQQWISGDRASFGRRVRSVTTHVLFLNVPAAVALVFMAEPIVTVLFERGAFDNRATELTANALRFFAVGLAGHATVEVLVRGFFAMQDTRTPVVVGAGSLLLHMGLSWGFSLVMGQSGIALGVSIGVLVEAIILAGLLRRHAGVDVTALDWRRIAGIGLASGIMAVVLLVLLLTTWQPRAGLTSAGLLAVYCVAATVTYLGVAQLTCSSELGELRRQVARGLRGHLS